MRQLETELIRLVDRPSEGEKLEELDKLAMEILGEIE
jgi:hypothetical protein